MYPTCSVGFTSLYVHPALVVPLLGLYFLNLSFLTSGQACPGVDSFHLLD